MSRKIIVRMPNWLGDFVMATPVLSNIHAAWPDAEITAVLPAAMAELLREDPAVHQIIPARTRETGHAIRVGQYDLGFLLTNSFSSAWQFFCARVKQRIGYATDFRSFLLTDPIQRCEPTLHQVERYQKLLETLGISVQQMAPRLFLSNGSQSHLEGSGYRAGEPLIGINPGAAYGSAKCWLPDRFRNLAQRLSLEMGFTVLFFGDASSKPLVDSICNGLPTRVINLAGKTTLRELANLILQCDVLVTNDSGPMHMAAAIGVPLVALFGSTNEKTTGPWGQMDAVIHKQLSCAPCLRRVCPTDFSCMKAISVDEVIQKVCEKRRKRV